MIRLSDHVRAMLGFAAKDVRTFDRLGDSSKFLVALSASGKPLYAGTVSAQEKARRRAANKVARASRRINRAA